MKSRRRRTMIAFAGAAVVILLFETIGWWQWRRVATELELNPDSGAKSLADEALVSLPPFVHRARKLSLRELGSANRVLVVDSLTRIGSLQAWWISADPSGFSHLSHAALLGDQPSAALALLGQALERDPVSPSLRRLRAMVLLYLGALDEAMADLAVAQAVAPGLQTPEIELAPEDADSIRLEALRIRSELYPRKRTETALNMARLLRSRGDLEGAEGVLDDFDGQPEIELERARWAIESGDFGTAVVILEGIASARGYPSSIRARAWSELAVVRDSEGDHEGALQAAQTALQLQPTSPAPYITLAGLAQRRGDADQALGHLRRAWGMSPTDVGLLTRIAVVAEGSGKVADATLALERAVELRPGEPRYPAALAALQLRTGAYSEAATTLTQALNRFPTDPELLRLAERLQRDIGIR